MEAERATDAEIASIEPLKRLTRDLKTAAQTLQAAEARFLVDAYYLMQKDRIRAANQVRALSASQEPHQAITWLTENAGVLERNVRAVLDAYSAASPVGRWARSQVGIGPVISAGLLAHIDIARAPTVGHIWRFAGLDPTVTWEKKTKRPWNAALKRLMWIAGESFVKTSGHKDSVYGRLYVERKALELERNQQGLFAEQAKRALEQKNYREDTTARASYEAGQLPPARIHLRAERWAVKLFLAAYHEVAFVDRYHTLPPKPYVLEHLGHVHHRCPPLAPVEVVTLRRQAGWSVEE